MNWSFFEPFCEHIGFASVLAADIYYDLRYRFPFIRYKKIRYKRGLKRR